MDIGKSIFYKKCAFTLAEVLITLGIISVVAALTMPTLISNYQKQVRINKVKKFYSLMSQAVSLSVTENGPMEYWDGFTTTGNYDETQHWVDKYIRPYIKVVNSGAYGAYTLTFADGSKARFSNWAGSNVDIDKETGKDKNHSADNFNGLVHVNFITDGTYEDSRLCTNRFVFLLYDSATKRYGFFPYAWGATLQNKSDRAYILSMVKLDALTEKRGGSQWCTLLLMSDNWEMKEDYPYNE